MIVRLKEDEQSLSDVVVTGYGNAKSKETAANSPKLMIRGVSALTSNAVEVNTVEKQTNVTFDIQNPDVTNNFNKLKSHFSQNALARCA